jgi:hypothetical protein
MIAPESPFDKGLDGGDSSTPLLLRCLLQISENVAIRDCLLTRSPLVSCYPKPEPPYFWKSPRSRRCFAPLPW